MSIFLQSRALKEDAHPRRMMASNQRGSIAVIAAIGISTMIIVLASIDIGYLFYQKRDLQKVADLAALAGAQQLARSSTLPNPCASAVTVAKANADAQVSQAFSASEFASTCGRWDPAVITAAPHYLAYAGGVTPSGNPPASAVRVWVSRSFHSFFGSWANRNVAAMAIATAGAPIAVFSVESRLLRIKDGTVPKLLADLGVDIKGTSLLSYDGIANAKVTAGGLLGALGFNIPLTADVGTIKNLIALGTPKCPSGVCPLNELLGAMSTVGGQSDLINALGIQSGSVKLLTDAGGRGLMTLVDLANGKSVLEANIKSAELLSTAIVLANSNHPAVAAGVNLNLPSLVSVDTKIGIVEPPSIGIGGIGTTAVTSQVRVFAQAKSNLLNVGLLNANLLSADIPLAIDVVNGIGTITDMCTRKVDGKDVATIAISAPLLKLCVGDFNSSSAFSKTSTCSDNLQNHTLLNVLNGKLSVNTSFTVDALPNTDSQDFVKGQTKSIGRNDLQFGTTVSNLMSGLIAKLISAVFNQGKGSVTSNDLAGPLLGAVSQTGNVLNNALAKVETMLTGLRNFATGVNANSSLAGLLGGVVTGLLSTVGTLANGLLNVVGNLLTAVFCLGNQQCILGNQLAGDQGSISKVLLTILSMVTELLKPVLDALGLALATQLEALLGTQLGQVDVTLIDLNCGGGDTARLVH
ncbi:pilus assembly protein TadG-related protein [Herminiimonas contaminans]|uniref:Putative Flp pilus-assembly TadG-like N-terminal domain-containing protein n=1 Tax=Herminiimonas contaminans TaxID=1111140 RepID=A0ABS0EWL6_9BURK|nr:pilus assembly protein TadG-related protein [Herminiimonas contaminans]MBF8178484.1 hypothetical protein [Herminiimonas contaminans]